MSIVMSEKTSLTTLISQYQKLCQYCDEVFAATFDAFRAHIRCARGCAACCILETIVPLEAYVIDSHLHTSSSPILPVLQDGAGQSTEQCIFLHNNECTIYPVRPIICRTHGLPIIYPDREGIDTCPLNFTDIDLTSIDKRFLFDAETITENLMRLNLAFCIMTQKKDSAGDRIPLHWLITGQWEWFNDT
jgi:hypothetical protein